LDFEINGQQGAFIVKGYRTLITPGRTRNPLLIALTASLGALLVCIGVAFGHGGEHHDSTEAAEAEAVDTLTPSEDAARDSVFATIQAGFVALEPIFKKGCFDCHTDQTDYPWYYKLPLVQGMIDDDTRQAKKHVDMSNGFPFAGHGNPADDLAAIRSEVVEGDMPPWNYRLMHWSAKPSEVERDSIVDWTKRGLESLATVGIHPEEDE